LLTDASVNNTLTAASAVSAATALQAVANPTLTALPAATTSTALVLVRPLLAQPVAVILVTPPVVLRFEGPTATGAASIEPEQLTVIGSVPAEVNNPPALPPAEPAAAPPVAPVVPPVPVAPEIPAEHIVDTPFVAAFDVQPDFTENIAVAPLADEGDGAFTAEAGLVAAALIMSGAWNVQPADGQPDKRRWFEYATKN
jgi:hypothetical protein